MAQFQGSLIDYAFSISNQVSNVYSKSNLCYYPIYFYSEFGDLNLTVSLLGDSRSIPDHLTEILQDPHMLLLVSALPLARDSLLVQVGLGVYGGGNPVGA